MTMEMDFIADAFEADLVREGGPFVLGGGLKESVLISLFTDARAQPDDIAAGLTKEPRGWWADSFAEVAGSQTGSRLWLTRRSNITESLLPRIEAYADEALRWLVEDGVAVSVDVSAERWGRGGVELSVDIKKPDGTVTRWAKAWEPNAL